MQIKKCLFLVLVFFLLLSSSVSAQSDLKSIYLSQRDKYFKVHDEFLSLRRTYWQQGTIESKEKFRQKSRNFLLARDDLILSYFDLLLSKSSFVEPEYQEQISNWQGWVVEHRKKIGKAYSLEDLVSLSKEFDEIYPEIERSIYTFLFNRVVTRQEEIKNNTKKLSQQLAVQTTNDDWQIEVNKELKQLDSYWQEGETLLDRVRIVRPGDMRKRWDKIAEELSLAKNSLLKALNYLDEVISKSG